MNERQIVKEARKIFKEKGLEFPKGFKEAKKFLIESYLETERLNVEKQFLEIYEEFKNDFTIEESDNFLLYGRFIKEKFENTSVEELIKILSFFKIGKPKMHKFFIKSISYLKKTNIYSFEILSFLDYSFLCFKVIDTPKKIIEKESESEYEKRVINNFEKIFPNYEFIKNQVILEGGERIDILAKDKKSKKDVIIELKINSCNPKRQLMLYASYFEKPILVSLTKENCKNKHKEIIYITYD